MTPYSPTAASDNATTVNAARTSIVNRCVAMLFDIAVSTFVISGAGGRGGGEPRVEVGDGSKGSQSRRLGGNADQHHRGIRAGPGEVQHWRAWIRGQATQQRVAYHADDGLPLASAGIGDTKPSAHR